MTYYHYHHHYFNLCSPLLYFTPHGTDFPWYFIVMEPHRTSFLLKLNSRLLYVDTTHSSVGVCMDCLQLWTAVDNAL